MVIQNDNKVYFEQNKSMIRVEIYANQELLEDIKHTLHDNLPQQYYSIHELVGGYGKKGYAFGDVVWPEVNICCVIMISESTQEAQEERVITLRTLCDEIQSSSPKNSITLFAYKIQSL